MAKEHIVIVEDEEDILELLRYHLTREGYSVTTAANGEQALKIISQKMPALVLLDLMLPGLNGLELCRRLKQDPRTAAIPIMMVTAKNEESDIPCKNWFDESIILRGRREAQHRLRASYVDRLI